MIGQRGIGSRIFQNTAADHILRPLKGLLCCLEHELDGSAKLSLVLLEHFCRSQ